MQLASIPKNVISANQQVVGNLQQAWAATKQTQTAVDRAGIDAGTKSSLATALAAARAAQDGASALGGANLLEGSFHRYTTHAVRDLADAVAILDRSGSLGADATKLFTEKLFSAEVATRLGTKAGERSLAQPTRTSIDGGTTGSGSVSRDSGPVWVDGEWLDGSGNPVRGGDSWAGPDGERFGSDGSPSSDGGSWVGPDGDGFDGI